MEYYYIMNEDILGLEYDLDKMKKNIRDLMTDSHMTQEQLERKTGISQSRISKVLNSKKNSDAFTIQQLVSIAQVFGVSTDQILGLNIPTKEKKESEITLFDILIKLFEVDKLTAFEIKEYILPDNPKEQDNTKKQTKHQPYILFKNNQINKILSEWKEIKSLGSNSEMTKQTITNLQNLWKENIISRAKGCPKKWNFRSKKDEQKEIMNRILNDYENCPYPDDFFPMLFPDEWELLEEYYNSGKYISDFPEHESFITWLLPNILK